MFHSKKALAVLVLCCSAYVLSMFHRVCPAVLSPWLSADLGLDNSALGMMSGMTFLSYAVMQLPSGLLADRIGGRKSLCLLLAAASAGAFAFAFSTGAASAMGARLLEGAGLAITIPCMVILANEFPAGTYARVSSIFLCCGGLGSILAAKPLAAAASAAGWRGALLFCSALLVAALVLTWIFVKDPEKGASAKRTESRGSMAGNIAAVLRSRAFWPPAIWSLTVMGTFFTMFSLWWGPYLTKGCGLSAETAATVLTMGAMLNFVSQPLSGWISDSVLHSRRIPMLVCTACCVAAGAVMCFRGVSGMWEAAALVLLFVIGTATSSPLAFVMLRDSFPISLYGTASGLMNILPPLWSVLLQKAYGAVLDFGGGTPEAFRMASWIVMANACAGLAACLLMKDAVPRADGEHA